MANVLMQKKYIFIAVLIMILFTLTVTGCSQDSAPANPKLSEISQQIKQTADMSNMQEADSSKLEKFYDIDAENLEDFILYTPASNIKTNEIALFRVKEAANIEEVQDKIQKRIDKQSTNFKDYLPEEYFLVEKHVLTTNGNYILLAISTDAEEIDDVFNGFFE